MVAKNPDVLDQPISRIVRGPVVASIEAGCTAREVAAELTGDDVGALLVEDAHGPVGVVSERDLALVLGTGGDPDKRQAVEVMTPDIVWAVPAESIRVVAQRMCAAGIRHVFVRDSDDRVLGVVSARDILVAVVGMEPPT